LERLQLFVFPVGQADPQVPKARIQSDLPDTALRTWMFEKHHPTNGLPGNRDGDAAPAIGLMRSDYVRAITRVAFSRWVISDQREVPAFAENPSGRAILITGADSNAASDEWWRALTNPAAYH
jgi:hypothetical protein